MIAFDLPVPLLWALRWALFLGPLAACAILVHRARQDRRALVGCLFAFLYGLGLIFVTHILADAMGWWRYGGQTLMLQGIPADIWIGGALLFGPVLFLAFPRMNPLWLLLPIVTGLHGMFFLSLPPLVHPGPGWFLGVVTVFATAHFPALTLARWTAQDRRLPERAALLALGYGFLAFGVLPCLILKAMAGETGGGWNLASRPPLLTAFCLALLAPLFVLSLSAVQLFVIYGQGTPIPLDPTQRLVRTGVFAYVTNPMQVSTAASWVVMGLALGSPWIAAAALMAWVFVLGMVRWHHRHDLLVRFPQGWPEYRAHVPEWRPRWRPWIPEASSLTLDPAHPLHARLGAWLACRDAVGLSVESVQGARLRYDDGTVRLHGLLAVLKSLEHVKLAWALVGAAGLLVGWPLAGLRRRWLARSGAKCLARHA